MKKTLIAFSLTCLVLASCGPFSYWRNFYDPWSTSCPDFPSLEQVEQVIEEHRDLFEELKEQKLINWVDVRTCPEGAYIAIFHGAQGQITPVLEIMASHEAGARTEGLDRFFGIPFRFVNV